ncbi:MAG: HlyD family type I secretion periplasmic adaptor subunit [Tissierellales bacterium]|jgi:hemolysin D|nr:HlyD family type I secretion periplasmic adaptor subunit [Tissierellales bacterium]
MKLFKEKDIRTEFLPSALEIIETPESPLGKAVIWLISLILLSAITWSIFCKVDEVSIARGRVVPNGNIKVMQSLEGGSIENINVKEGQNVKAGQLLMKFDTSILEDEKDKIETALNTAKLERKLLIGTINGNDEKIEDSNGIDVESFDMQSSYNDAKDEEYLKKQEALENNIKSSVKELEREQKKLDTLNVKLRKLEDEEDKYRKLYENDGITEYQYNTKKAELDSVIQEVEVQKTNIEISSQRIASMRNQKKLSAADYNKSNMKEIVEKDKAIQQLEKELSKVNKRIEKQTIVSPIDGIVQSISENTIGGVVAAGKSIVSIVPDGSELVIEASVLNRDIGFIEVGQEAEIKFDAFPFQRYGVIEGEVVYISPDAVRDQQLGYVYKAKVRMDKNFIHIGNKDVDITPGMTVTVEAKVGERRIIDFFIPGIKSFKESFELR